MTFPLGKVNPPLAYSVPPQGEMISPLGKVNPPLVYSILPQGEMTFPRGKAVGRVCPCPAHCTGEPLTPRPIGWRI